MTSRRIDHRRIKINHSYTARELAETLGVHKNTVRNWQRKGLAANDVRRPALFHGTAVRNFLNNRNAARKRPCPPGTFYCFCCREPKRPAAGMVDYDPRSATAGNLIALCETCGTAMYRRAQRSAIPDVMLGISVAVKEGQERLSGSPSPSLNSDTNEDR